VPAWFAEVPEEVAECDAQCLVTQADADRLALEPLPKLHPAVKPSPEVTDLTPGAGRPGGAGPGHGYGACPGRILARRWHLLSRRVDQLLPESLLVR
jgi:hypothetical protein